jgi:hypothetical protein
MDGWRILGVILKEYFREKIKSKGRLTRWA